MGTSICAKHCVVIVCRVTGVSPCASSCQPLVPVFMAKAAPRSVSEWRDVLYALSSWPHPPPLLLSHHQSMVGSLSFLRRALIIVSVSVIAAAIAIMVRKTLCGRSHERDKLRSLWDPQRHTAVAASPLAVASGAA